MIGGTFPRKPTIQVLAPTDRSQNDPKSFKKATTVPTRVVHVPSENRTKGCYVHHRIYSNFQECHDNIWRKKVRYNYTDPTHDLIAQRVWDHVERTPEEASHEHGRGAITSEGSFKHHGDPHENFMFKVHGARPPLRAPEVRMWRPHSETIFPAKEFCKAAKLVHSFASGVSVWRCTGHGGQVDTLAEYPMIFNGQLLRGKKLVVIFSGVPEESGALLSRAWEAAGGFAIRHDNRIDPNHNFTEDEGFWQKEIGEPAGVYHFAPPYATFTSAHTTLIVRTRADPYGDGSDPATMAANLFVAQKMRIIFELVPGGATIIIDNPMGSHFWELDMVLLRSGMDGSQFIRSDHCMSGAPYQKPQLWLTTRPGLVRAAAAVCCHPRPHPPSRAPDRMEEGEVFTLSPGARDADCARTLRHPPLEFEPRATVRRPCRT